MYRAALLTIFEIILIYVFSIFNVKEYEMKIHTFNACISPCFEDLINKSKGEIGSLDIIIGELKSVRILLILYTNQFLRSDK